MRAAEAVLRLDGERGLLGPGGVTMTVWLAGIGLYALLLVCVLALVGATRAKEAIRGGT